MGTKGNKKKLFNILGFIESAFTGIYMTVDVFANFINKLGGRFALLLFPISDGLKFLTKGVKFYQKSEVDQNSFKSRVNFLFYFTKFLLTSVGIGVALTGMPLIGFSVAIAGMYLSSLKSLYKIVRDFCTAVRDGLGTNLKKDIENNALAGFQSFILATAFVIFNFVPGAHLLAYGMIAVVTSLGALRALLNFIEPNISKELTKDTSFGALAVIPSDSSSIISPRTFEVEDALESQCNFGLGTRNTATDPRFTALARRPGKTV